MAVKRESIRDKQAELTRTALLAVARRLFAQRGYPDVSVDEIVQAAKVTKGALYHHYKDKLELFRDVVEELETETRTRLVAAAERPGDAMSRLRAACHEYLDACTVQEVGRIVVLDSPAVLGWADWCKINREYGLGFFVERLEVVRKGDPANEATAHMLLGSLNGAVRVIAEAADKKAARALVGETIDRVLAAIAGPG